MGGHSVQLCLVTEWAEIKDLKEFFALDSNKPFRSIVHQAHAAEQSCADGKGIIISAEIPKCLGSG